MRTGRWHGISVMLRWLGLTTMMCSCQKRPSLSPAADDLSAIAAPPMGAKVYNDELKRELNLLDDLLNGRVDKMLLSEVKGTLMRGHIDDVMSDRSGLRAELMKLLLAMPELIRRGDSPDDIDKLWFKAKLYFMRRRFIEASMLMSQILKDRPELMEARNLRARAIFFLGNPDLAIDELNRIVENTPSASVQGLDALYLIGAMCYESNDFDERRLKVGIDAWDRYLKAAKPDELLRREIADGLAELRARSRGEKPGHGAITDHQGDPFSPSESYSQEKNAIMSAFLRNELLLTIELCEQALIAGYDADIATIKARTLFKMGRIDEASDLFKNITERSPRYAPGFHYSGMGFMLKGQPQEAIAAWRRAMELDAVYGDANNLGQRIRVAEGMISREKPIDTH